MNRLIALTAAALAVVVSCSAPDPSPSSGAPIASSSSVGTTETPSIEALDAPRVPVSADRRVAKTLMANLDLDPAEEQILVLQNRANLSLPVVIQVADYDQTRSTFYLAWEGTALASASQPLSLSLEDIVGDHQLEVLVRGLDQSGLPSLDVLRLNLTTGGLGLSYRTVFSRVSRGTIEISRSVKPDTYVDGQGTSLSDTIVVDEPDPNSADPRETVRTTYSWLFQKGEFVVTGTERYQRSVAENSTLEKLFSGDNLGLETFLQGPWVKAVPDKAGLLILFFDRVAREIIFANDQAQEVYHWEVSSRSSRGSLYVVGSNDLINLIKLQMSIAVTAADTLEVTAQDNPGWTGTYRKLDPSAALVLAHQGTQPLPQSPAPEGVYRNDKGDEFDFQVPEVRLRLGGVSFSGSMAVYPLGEVTVLQIKVPARPGNQGFSRAYALVWKEESNTSRVVRTLRLQGGILTSKGWVSDQSDPLRLEQVEGAASR